MADVAIERNARRSANGAQARQFANRAEAKVDRGLSDDAAADPADPASGDLSRVLLAASGDPEQVDAALHRAWKLPVPVQARNLLAGGRAILHFRDHRRDLQGADRLHRRPLRPQHSGQGPAQMARHAAGAVGDSAGDEHAGVAVAVRSVLQRLQLSAGGRRHRPDSMDRRGRLGPLLGHPGQYLVRRPVLHDHVSGGAEVGARSAL